MANVRAPGGTSSRDYRLSVAAAGSRDRARRLDLFAVTIGAYAILAVVASVIQARRLSDSLDLDRTIGWLTWWSLTALMAAAACIACVVGARILTRMATNVEAIAGPLPGAYWDDHYR